MSTTRIAIYSSTVSLQSAAAELAEHLNLPLVLDDEHHYEYLLTLTPDYLGLKQTGSNGLPLTVNFLSPKMQHRRQQVSLKKEALARALGLKKALSPKIIDATGGLARDSFIIASLGFNVDCLERSPIIHALIADGVKRAAAHPELVPSISRLNLIRTDAITWLQQLNNSERPNIIYLDPMYPPRKKTALPKQDMLIFHSVVGKDQDAEALLNAALACATKRVVVKRPRLADALAGARQPSYSLRGSSSRFDVYLI